MAAMFSASVRAPLTGIVLTIEMTGRGDLTLGLLGASLAAMLVAILLQSEPIYETLKRRMLAKATETSGFRSDLIAEDGLPAQASVEALRSRVK
jgi:H+/Cl- antiporter ClcA